MKKVSLLLSLLTIACGESVGDVSMSQKVAAQASSALSSVVTQNVQTPVTYAPVDFVFPMECLGELFQYVGTVTWIDQYVVPPNGQDYVDIFTHTFDPPTFTSLTTGDTWEIGPGYSAQVAAKFDGTDYPQSAHEFVPMVNQTTGEHVRTRLVVTYHKDANGNIKVFRFSFECKAR